MSVTYDAIIYDPAQSCRAQELCRRAPDEFLKRKRYLYGLHRRKPNAATLAAISAKCGGVIRTDPPICAIWPVEPGSERIDLIKHFDWTHDSSARLLYGTLTQEGRDLLASAEKELPGFWEAPKREQTAAARHPDEPDEINARVYATKRDYAEFRAMVAGIPPRHTPELSDSQLASVMRWTLPPHGCITFDQGDEDALRSVLSAEAAISATSEPEYIWKPGKPEEFESHMDGRLESIVRQKHQQLS